jgi:hypothetical protein
MVLTGLDASLKRPSGRQWGTRVKQVPPAHEFVVGRRHCVNQ